MALTIENQIKGQQVDDVYSYFYLYEPLPIVVTESDLTARRLSIMLNLFDTSVGTTIANFTDYAIYDINPGVSLNIDIAKIIRQAHDSNIYNFSSLSNIVDAKNSITDRFRYRLDFTTDATIDPVLVRKFPIVGGRFFKDFEGRVDENTPITEFQVEGVDVTNKWKNYPVINSSLRALDFPNESSGLNTITVSNGSECADGGMVYWKSRLGGWMQWGFQIKVEKHRSSYNGNLEVDYFDTIRDSVNSDPFIPVNYTSIEVSNSIDLKSLSLSSEELRAVSSIATSPAVYYMKSPNSRLELMRVSNSTHPLNNQSNGGDFSLSLTSISKMNINTR